MATNNNLQQALDILSGNTVIAHDRRKGDATAIDFTRKTVKGETALQPAYGVSTAMQQALTKLAKRVDFVPTKRGRTMPAYIFGGK